MAKFDKSVLAKYGITGTTEVLYNPSYEVLFNEETKEGLEGFEGGQETELGAVNVMTGIYTGRSPKEDVYKRQCSYCEVMKSSLPLKRRFSVRAMLKQLSPILSKMCIRDRGSPYP